MILSQFQVMTIDYWLSPFQDLCILFHAVPCTRYLATWYILNEYSLNGCTMFWLTNIAFLQVMLYTVYKSQSGTTVPPRGIHPEPTSTYKFHLCFTILPPWVLVSLYSISALYIYSRSCSLCIYLVIYLFNKYSLNFFYSSAITLRAGDIAVHKR